MLVKTLRTDQRLKMAAEQGDIHALYSTIEEDRCILDHIDQTPFLNTPLHTAASKGHTKFALEIRRLKPSFGRKLNQDGFSPLHLAVYRKNYETAIQMIDEDGHLVRVKGKMGRTPLHIAVEQGDMDLVAACLTACPASIEDVTDHKETALHIASKNDRTEAINSIVNWLEYTGNRVVQNWADMDGNTILHIASLKNQIEVVRLLTNDLKYRPSVLLLMPDFLLVGIDRLLPFRKLNNEDGSTVLLSLKNSQGLTAMDILQQQGHMQIKEIENMRSAAAQNKNHVDYGSAEYLKKKISSFDKRVINYFRKNLRISDEHRSGVITVAVLIATATYQAVLSPPRGLSQGGLIPNASPAVRNDNVDNNTGTSLMSVPQWWLFAALNTVTFYASIAKINDLLFGGGINVNFLVFPLVLCYTTAISSIAPRYGDFGRAHSTYITIIVLSFLLYIKGAAMESSITRYKKVFKSLQLRHHTDECKL
ncbi:ankyrin repeat-containing protein BDA1-like [Mercurialis annua]|uniref:ankyrin repeat-containing protein BDA1-like n=1 Tax=Mercurialis annua TaxID=3986 RepID=UPI00215EFC62|nr:ankyrin repeat-containing protein BDA1-like [Mercurialis annua]